MMIIKVHNRLASISGGRDIEFTLNAMGALTLQNEYLTGEAYVFAGATYSPSGLLYAKADYDQQENEVTNGNTVMTDIMPNGEMVAKVNWSTTMPKAFAYDLSGNLLEEAAPTDETNPSSNEPIIDHIYLGGHRLASITGKGNVCIIATVAFGSPLADELYVFRAFRDRVLMRMSPGKAFVEWYYHEGPRGAEWLKVHSGPRLGARVFLTVLAVPLKGLLFGGWPLLLTLCLCVSVVIIFSFRRGWTWRRATATSLGLAFGLAIIYAYFIEVPKAMADYTELSKYYYTEDHIGRPFSLRDSNLTLRWYENHYAFGEIINETIPNGAMYAGGSSYQISWKPSFRFPGQYEDTDQGIAYNNTSFMVQNRFREYMPGFGIYSRIDLIDYSFIGEPNSIYNYVESNSINLTDSYGLAAFYDTMHSLANYISPCIMRVFNYEYNVNPSNGPHKYDWKYHCKASCRFMCECNLTAKMVVSMGAVWEVGQFPSDPIMDSINNSVGIDCAKYSFERSSFRTPSQKCCNIGPCKCESCCECADSQGLLMHHDPFQLFWRSIMK